MVWDEDLLYNIIIIALGTTYQLHLDGHSQIHTMSFDRLAFSSLFSLYWVICTCLDCGKF